VPLFEQIRTGQPEYSVPLTGKTQVTQEKNGAAHVAGLNFGRPGEVQNCVGCHAGHSMIPVPDNPEDAKWTNLAPGASVDVSSSSNTSPDDNGLIDRRVHMSLPFNNFIKYWLSDSGKDPNQQWIELTFPVPVTVRIVRLYNLPQSDSDIHVNNTTVRLYSDADGTQEVANNTSGPLSEWGTDVAFADIQARVVRIEFNSVSGYAAGLAEVEVIARAEAGP
jgi:hypothetical protein